MRPEVRPRKLTRRSASPSAKVFKIRASVSRAGMKCRRDRLGRGIRKVSGQARRTCRTRLNTTGGDASQCWRGGVVEEREEKLGATYASKAIFKTAKPSSITFNVGAPTFLGSVGMLTRWGARGVSPLKGSGLFVAGYPVLTHWAKLCRASGAGPGFAMELPFECGGRASASGGFKRASKFEFRSNGYSVKAAARCRTQKGFATGSAGIWRGNNGA